MAREDVETRREWDYRPEPDGEPFTDKDGNEVLGWADRVESDDEATLRGQYEAYARDEGLIPDSASLTLRPILVRTASDIECRINGWEEGTFVRCTPRAKKSWPMWQIEVSASTPQPADQQEGEHRG